MNFKNIASKISADPKPYDAGEIWDAIHDNNHTSALGTKLDAAAEAFVKLCHETMEEAADIAAGEDDTEWAGEVMDHMDAMVDKLAYIYYTASS